MTTLMTKKPSDSTYQNVPYKLSEIEHNYGDNYHVLADPFLLTHLAHLCSAETKQPAINTIVANLYEYLVREVINVEFPKSTQEVRTRMADSEGDRGYWTGQIIDQNTRAVTVNVARAGTLPSQVCFDFLNKTINPDLVRQDHVIMARTTDSAGQVTGASFGGSKIGGDVDNAIVLFPDPMGATGTSLVKAITHYKEEVGGTAKNIVAINLIVTPEYLKRMKEAHPDVKVYAVRLDRGASSDKVLASKPGTHIDEESGLTDIQYIIPGGGGFGEIMNNSYC